MGDWFIALIPAFNECVRVAQTVEAIQSIDVVKWVVVVDDGSSDDTAVRAAAAGARCLRLEANTGKGSALNAGVTAIRHWLLIEGLRPPTGLLLADADLGRSAVHLDRLICPVLGGELDVAVADLPPQTGASGFGVAMWLGRRTLLRFAGREMRAPLSGQRALAWRALGSVFPFAGGFAVEVAMTIDALGAGLRVGEVPVPLMHRATRCNPPGIVHRGSQALAIVTEYARREVRSLVWTGSRRALRL